VYCVLRWRAFAACLAAALIAFLSLGGGGLGEPQVVSSPEDLRDALREAQWGLLPLEAAVLYDAGDMLFLPDGGGGDAFLLALLFSTEDWEGAEVTVSEDPATRETLFLGPGGNLFWVLPPEEGYSPWWALGLLFPEGFPAWAEPGAFDPSLVSVRVAVWPLAFPDIPDPHGGGKGRAGQGLGRPDGQDPGGAVAPPDKGTAVALAGDELPATGRTNVLDAAGVTLLSVVPSGGSSVVYVDAARGNDTWTGRSALSRGGGEGPKRTVAAGMVAVREGGSLVVGEGAYPESLDVRGAGVRVTFTGNVALGRAAERRMRHGGGAAPGVPLVIPPANAPTGTVANVQN